MVLIVGNKNLILVRTTGVSWGGRERVVMSNQRKTSGEPCLKNDSLNLDALDDIHAYSVRVQQGKVPVAPGLIPQVYFNGNA